MPLPLDMSMSLGSEPPRDTNAPTLSLIVPTHNRRERLARLLSRLEHEHGRGTSFEVVVAVDGSTDGTEEMLATLRTSYRLRVVSQTQRGAAAARNAAIAAALGDVLLFVDDDVLPHDGLLERHLAVHRQDPLAVVAGRMARPPGHIFPVWLDWEAAILERHYSRLVSGRITPSWREFFTANASVRREHVLAVGGFDERFLREEDIELAYRLSTRGLRSYFLSDAVVHHKPEKSLEVWLRLMSERGRYHHMLHSEMDAKGELSIVEDWRHRHVLNRMLTQWCLCHPNRARFVVEALERSITSPRRGLRRVQFFLCSALVNIKYWAGVAQVTGVPSGLWRLSEQAAADGTPRDARRGK
jgi:GT2 family glycosyltransferase